VTAEWTPARLGDLTGKRIIVTGATNGVGLGTARALTQAGAHVIMAVRNTDLGAQRAKEIGGSTSIAKVDLADLSSVRAFADALDGDVDILINNAGMLTADREETVDGFEKTIGTNLLGPFALTNLIFDRIRSQIINVGSQAHRGGTLHLDDMHLRTNTWTAMGAYSRAKLAVMMWGLDLDRRLREANSPVVTQLTHPGWVSSNLSSISDSRMMAAADKVVKRLAGLFGDEPVLHQRTDPARRLRRHRRQVGTQRGTGDDRTLRAGLRLRGRRPSCRIRRKGNGHKSSRLAVMQASRRPPGESGRPLPCRAPVRRPATGAPRHCPTARHR
jgi:NAD(P)-dependent dehydrogenase (short-subunit alcohol dehydrogenase family)